VGGVKVLAVRRASRFVYSEPMDKERTTQEVMQKLGDDCDRCHEHLMACIDAGTRDSEGNIEADYEFYARQFIRAVFAYLEATTYSVKAWSAGYCMENDIEITPQERYFATDTEYELDEKGKVIEAIAKISLARNIRFALSLNRRAHKVAEPFDASVKWWGCLREAIKIRDRLTHPKMPADLDVSPEDIIKVIEAKVGFEQEVMRHSDSDAPSPP